ncbi:MAG: hypothetical protein OXE94_10125 [Aestuariivita sp.]|nr:hypothetical protein [Aestuariivita sp.]MCY4202809.1 hypothetical protein [Aestuariivita sp.]
MIDRFAIIWRRNCGFPPSVTGLKLLQLAFVTTIDDFAFDTPAVFWAVDDIWLSGCLAIKKIPIWFEKIAVKARFQIMDF